MTANNSLYYAFGDTKRLNDINICNEISHLPRLRRLYQQGTAAAHRDLWVTCRHQEWGFWPQQRGKTSRMRICMGLLYCHSSASMQVGKARLLTRFKLGMSLEPPDAQTHGKDPVHLASETLCMFSHRHCTQVCNAKMGRPQPGQGAYLLTTQNNMANKRIQKAQNVFRKGTVHLQNNPKRMSKQANRIQIESKLTSIPECGLLDFLEVEKHWHSGTV